MEFNSMTNVLDLIAQVYHKPDKTDPIVFHVRPVYCLFPEIANHTLYLNMPEGSCDHPGMYRGYHPGLGKPEIITPVTYQDPEYPEDFHNQLTRVDDPDKTRLNYMHGTADLCPISLHVMPGEARLYAEYSPYDAAKILGDFKDMNPRMGAHLSAFWRLWNMDVPVEFVGSIRRGGEIQDTYELGRVYPRDESRREKILEVHQQIQDLGWKPVFLEVIDNRAEEYKPNIILWYYKEEPGRYPHIDYHLLDGNQ